MKSQASATQAPDTSQCGSDDKSCETCRKGEHEECLKAAKPVLSWEDTPATHVNEVGTEHSRETSSRLEMWFEMPPRV